MSADLQAVEAQARRYLALFPAWLRPTRGEEAVGLVLDLLPPDAQHLPWRSKLDLVRAGLHARRVGTPPAWVWSRVANAKRGSAPVPAMWLPWLSTLVQQRSFPARVRVSNWLPVFGIQALLWAILWGVGWALLGLVGLVVLVAVVATLRGRSFRHAVCIANGLAEDGRMRPPNEVATQWRAPSVRNHPIVRPLLLAAGSALVTGLPITLVWFDDRIDMFGLGFLFWPATYAFGWLGLAGWRALRGARSGASGWPLAERQGVGPVSPEAMDRLVDGIWVGSGVAVAWGSAWVAVGIGAPLAALAPGAVLLLAGLILANAQRRAGRTLGLWDAVPQWAPQVIVVARPDPELGDHGRGGALA